MSIVRSAVIAVLMTAGLAGVAHARGELATIRLAAPVEARTEVIASNTLWICNGDTCLARPNHGISVRACRQFIRQAGAVQVASYGDERRQLNADEIARCNA